MEALLKLEIMQDLATKVWNWFHKRGGLFFDGMAEQVM